MTMKMTWDKLLSDLRFPKPGNDVPSKSPSDIFRSDFEADYDRIIYSTPLRRLARKTQVHPLAQNDHVHTRLTHSLEVASVGRSLGHRLAHFLKKQSELPSDISEQDLVGIIQAACLAHDIGNPPFGHAGEFSIREWTKLHQKEVFGEQPERIDRNLRNDWELFDGNAQSFRIASRGDNSKTGYLRLTFASLGAMIKYPWDSSDLRAKKGKFNVFSTEKAFFKEMAKQMGMNQLDGTIVRHPLSFLSEAADDICYRMLDLEDAIEMGILGEDRVRAIHTRILAGKKEKVSKMETTNLIADTDPPTEKELPVPLAALRGLAIGALINEVWKVFQRDYENIMQGKREKDLKSDLPAPFLDAIEDIKKLYLEIFAESKKIAAELGSYKALGRIIKALCHATQQLSKVSRYEDSGFLAQRCLELAWGKDYAITNEKQSYEWWLHQVLDYVSGLTDNYARQLSREIEGT